MLFKEEHVILVCLQREDATAYYRNVARVMDSALWTFTASERIRIHEPLRESGVLQVDPERSPGHDSVLGYVVEWMSRPQQMQGKKI
jgi:hypothetical protein